ncbi:MAG: gamma-glutamyltransferase [Polyangiales bacterium]
MNGVIAAGNPHTAEAAAHVLRDGGNAVDAAVAGALAAFVAEPLLASAGGAGMLTLALAGRPPAVVDFFAAAPRARADFEHLDFEGVEVDFGSATQVFHIGRAAAAAPTALPGLAEAARRFGTQPLDALVAPAAQMAREGVPLTRESVEVIRLLWPIVERDAPTRALLAPQGRPPAPESIHRNPELAATLTEYGRLGRMPDRMRAELLRAFGTERGGLLSQDDLEATAPRVVEPHRIDLAPWQVMTSPRVGGRLVSVILEQLGAKPPEPRAADEAVRLARASLAGHRARDAPVVPGSTTHVSAIDGSGGVAAVTLTNGEGCGHLIPGTGVHMNNLLGEEDLNPGGFHRHAPGARLPTMIAPTVALRNGEPVLALGSGGANRIRSAVSQVLYRATRLGWSLEDAVLAPRVHAEDDTVWLELAGVNEPDAAVAALEHEFSRVYPFPDRAFFFGGVHAVERAEDGSLHAAGDPRRGGTIAHP